MKLIYTNEDKTYKVYDINIAGYPCHLHKTSECGYLIEVPIGDKPEDKAMFDELVYYNKGIYHSYNKDDVINQVATWIWAYKEQKKEGSL